MLTGQICSTLSVGSMHCHPRQPIKKMHHLWRKTKESAAGSCDRSKKLLLRRSSTAFFCSNMLIYFWLTHYSTKTVVMGFWKWRGKKMHKRWNFRDLLSDRYLAGEDKNLVLWNYVRGMLNDAQKKQAATEGKGHPRANNPESEWKFQVRF